MKLTITTGDIKAGKRRRKELGAVSGFDCPAALAARRAFKQMVYADNEFFYLVDGRTIAMHSELVEWVRAFDHGDGVAPVEFDLLEDHEEPSSI